MFTVVILAHNEEQNIAKALSSVSQAAEIIVVDDVSTDDTAHVAHKYTTKVLKRTVNGDFATARNWAMSKASNEWILFLDADEVVTPELWKELEVTVKQSTHAAYKLRRRDFFWGNELRWGETKNTRDKGIIRLIKKESGKWQGSVHEVFVTKGQVGKLVEFINHYPHPTISQFLRDINHYSTLRAQELFKMQKKASLFEIIFYPLFKFLYTYFLLLGFLDGSAGFVYSFMMSFHSFLVRAKLFQYRYL